MWKFAIFENCYFKHHTILYMKSKFYFANFVTSRHDVSILLDPRNRSLNLRFKFYNNYFYLYWFAFFFTFNGLSQIFFNKIKFRGKGYYVYKNLRNVIAFQFGFSHRVKVYLFYVNVKFLSKTSVLMFGLNKFDILKASHLFVEKRPVNVFTGRGVRFTRQAIYRKTGKISTYR